MTQIHTQYWTGSGGSFTTYHTTRKGARQFKEEDGAKFRSKPKGQASSRKVDTITRGKLTIRLAGRKGVRLTQAEFEELSTHTFSVA